MNDAGNTQIRCEICGEVMNVTARVSLFGVTTYRVAPCEKYSQHPVPRTSYHWLEVAASRIKAGELESEVMEDYGYAKLQQPAKCEMEKSHG